MTFAELFQSKKAIIGMVHLLPLPGSPSYGGDLAPVIHRAKEDALALAKAGFDGMIVENFCDTPYTTGAGALERTVAFTIVLNEVRRVVNKLLGVNIQFNDYEAEIITAGLCGADFVRVEAFVDSVTTVGGISPACSADAQRLKSRLGFKNLMIFADVHVKESSLIGSSTLEESIRNAEQAGADAIIITGSATGQATPMDAVRIAKQTTGLNILVGSGFNKVHAQELLAVVDGAIVGSSIKVDGKVTNPVDLNRAKELISIVRG
jgi:hypothetical protein